ERGAHTLTAFLHGARGKTHDHPLRQAARAVHLDGHVECVDAEDGGGSHGSEHRPTVLHILAGAMPKQRAPVPHIAGQRGVPNTWIQYGSPLLLRAMAAPICVRLGSRMFARCPDDDIQLARTASASGWYHAMFSAASRYTYPTACSRAARFGYGAPVISCDSF